MSSTSLHEDKMNISLLCPLSMSRRRIALPARGMECTHIQVCTTVATTSTTTAITTATFHFLRATAVPAGTAEARIS